VLKIAIILGSTRKNRQGERVARWVYNMARERDDFAVELLDLADWPLPFYEEALTPSKIEGKYTSDVARRWSEVIKEFDGYIMVTPEYSHGYPAVLKNAIDYLYTEWNNKAITFVSYSGGQLGGVRAVEQLRQVAIELQMAPIRESISIPFVWRAFDERGQLKDEALLTKTTRMFEQLLWWAKALKEARESKAVEDKEINRGTL
jgi:NAD(P)H-dependent FMN reductase